MTFLGLDGCKGGKWVVAKSDHRMRKITFAICTTEDAITARPSRDTIAVLDVPIGLSLNPRGCDEAARRLLRPHRHNSVFTPPHPRTCRFAAGPYSDKYWDHYRAGLALNEQLTGKGISSQAFGIAARVWHVNQAMTPAHQRTIREGHPEVSFAMMNGCRPLAHHKARPEGREERLALLRQSKVPEFDVDDWRTRFGAVNADDIIDAAAMLWTAARVANRTAVKLPGDKVQRNRRGLEMAIWA
jgi:predicted RNase H-like nuclease